ncbi:chaperone protein DnaJ [Limosilactobacillus frumenti DSM 13145]|uniref:Chaperone protein DnaJ n=1 Tax=Limosilactobacillus frumenti DSM 13145 TaxID=1423746 RepID=A0A0R1P3Y6_9LACO|nr:molecular chaperone DnaJ [Limosilactobacillus frumenti]KRL27007.1 chaperone protein DnaJ [Limosilactobacillus frumenti DSM 13145]MBA2914489.1 molecular chaperone DnaJ [Limosilactobacillus frumenti]QFG72484.1 molecular chaperone DnaJ [Limosilactobacillus frumenti]
MAEESYYDILGVSKDASDSDINHAYRRLAAKYHPDVNHAPGAEEKFKKINEAYEVLHDKQKRAQYDQFGSAGPQGSGGQGFGGFGQGQGFSQGFGAGGFDDIFSQFFGGGQRRQADPTAPRQGRDLQYTMTLKFMDAIFGKTTTIKYDRDAECKTCHGTGAKPGKAPVTCSRCGGRGFITSVRQTPLGNIQTQTTCPECNGSGKILKPEDRCTTCHGSGHIHEKHELEVKIPAGVDDGQQMRLQHQGDAGANGGPAGDLYIIFRVTPSREFRRDGSTIYVDQDISFAQAALGDQVKVKTVHGDVDLKIPAGTQSETNFRLRGKGVPHLNGSGNGDEHVTVHVRTPKSLNKRQREAMMAFAAASGEDVKGVKKSVLDKLRDAFEDK